MKTANGERRPSNRAFFFLTNFAVVYLRLTSSQTICYNAYMKYDFNKNELERLYISEQRTLKDMCAILGVKSPITARKILNSYGISTNHNERISNKTKHGMTDQEFADYLIKEYSNKEKSLRQIGMDLGVNATALRKYFKRFNIPLRATSEAKSIATRGSRSRNWNGGRNLRSNGYIEVYCPTHPKAKSRKYIYEHILVMEQHLGRCLKDNEIVHHINGNKTDNRIENLRLMTNSEHVASHGHKNKGRSVDILHGAWSKKYSCCTMCGTTTVKHKANGLCRNCYATKLRCHKKGVMPNEEY